MFIGFQTVLISILVGGVSVYNLDGTNFKDTFKRFEPTMWRRDEGKRHCGDSQQCIWASRENLKYVSDEKKEDPLLSTSLLITMRNDCDEEYCCRHGDKCTSYTSGQITSKHRYSYGSFLFRLRVEKEEKELSILATSFKSIRCTSNPTPEKFPFIFNREPTPGYCENEHADLFKYSSNRDLCHGRGKSICARFTWTIHNFAPSVFHFKARGKGIDYETSAIYLDGQLIMSGGRSLIQSFDIQLLGSRRHVLEVYGYENCCAGSDAIGYYGWNVDSNIITDALYKSDSENSPYVPYPQSGLMGGNDGAGPSNLGHIADGATSSFHGQSAGLEIIPDYFDQLNSPSPTTTEPVETTEVEYDTGSAQTGTLPKKRKTPESGFVDVASLEPPNVIADGSEYSSLYGSEVDDSSESHLSDFVPRTPSESFAGSVSSLDLESHHSEALPRTPPGSVSSLDGYIPFSPPLSPPTHYIPFTTNEAYISAHLSPDGHPIFDLAGVSIGNSETKPPNTLPGDPGPSYLGGGVPVGSSLSKVKAAAAGAGSSDVVVDLGSAYSGHILDADCSSASSDNYTWSELSSSRDSPCFEMSESDIDESEIDTTEEQSPAQSGIPLQIYVGSCPKWWGFTDEECVEYLGGVLPPEDLSEEDSDATLEADVPVTESPKASRKRPMSEASCSSCPPPDLEFDVPEDDQEFIEFCEECWDAMQQHDGNPGCSSDPCSSDSTATEDSKPVPVPITEGEGTISFSFGLGVYLRSIRSDHNCFFWLAGCETLRDVAKMRRRVVEWLMKHLNDLVYPLGYTQTDVTMVLNTSGFSHFILEIWALRALGLIDITAYRIHPDGDMYNWEDHIYRVNNAESRRVKPPDGTSTITLLNENHQWKEIVPTWLAADYMRKTHKGIRIAIDTTDDAIETTEEEITTQSTTLPPTTMFGIPLSSLMTFPHVSADTSSTEFEYDGLICFSLQRLMRNVNSFLRIAWCFSTENARKCLLQAQYARQIFEKITFLPFDASEKVGQYRIDWHPDKIVWKVDGQELWELENDVFRIPDESLSIKLYVAPEEPESSLTTLVEHKMFIQSVEYQKHQAHGKDELIIIGNNIDHGKLKFLMIASGLFLLFVFFFHLLFRNKRRHPHGYERLSGGNIDV